MSARGVLTPCALLSASPWICPALRCLLLPTILHCYSFTSAHAPACLPGRRSRDECPLGSDGAFCSTAAAISARPGGPGGASLSSALPYGGSRLTEQQSCSQPIFLVRWGEGWYGSLSPVGGWQ